MTQNPDIAFFEDLLTEPVNRLCEQARDQGRRAIGVTCSYVPAPLLSVDGLFPVRMRAPGAAGTPMADTYLSSVLCPYTRSILEAALDGLCNSLDGWVFTGSCDHLRRLFDNLDYLEKPPFNHIIDLPHKTGDAALEWFAEDLKTLSGALTEHFEVDTGADSLRRAIARHNRLLEPLRALGALRKREAPPISGADFHTVLLAAAVSPLDVILEPVEKYLSAVEADSSRTVSHRARLLLAGSQLDDPEYVRIIESQGALVVADRFCTGSIPGLEPVPETGDPLAAIAAHYLRKTSCPRMMEEFESRVRDIVNAAREYAVDGVIVQAMKFCDCWGVEAAPLTQALRDAGLPVLRLEREYSLTGEGQLRTRVQAFLESMGK